MAAFAAVTVREALDSAVIALEAGGSPSPRLDAEVLLATALGVSRTDLFVRPEAEVTGPAVRAFQESVRRRAVGREPVAYIVGEKGFRRIDLQVDGRVLVPRPETEHLVEAVIALAGLGARVIDVGTGSGAVALALKDERPDLDVTGVDVSEDASAVARANADGLGLDVTLRVADLLDHAGPGPFDVVAANLPYVPDGDRAGLPPEIARHEPPLALFGGADGLDVVRRLIAQAAARGDRALALEIGEGQADATAALMREAGYAAVDVIPDLAGIGRVVTGR